jgi:hypothetical protein
MLGKIIYKFIFKIRNKLHVAFQNIFIFVAKQHAYVFAKISTARMTVFSMHKNTTFLTIRLNPQWEKIFVGVGEASNYF